MKNKLGVGIIGVGNVSTQYLALGSLFNGYDILAVADQNIEAATERAKEFDVDVNTVEALLARDDIDIIVNLTTPAAHFNVTSQILDAGKHVYSEKPFVLSIEEGEAIVAKANEKGLRVASAPDTFLGASHQLARHIIDEGLVGNILSGTAIVQGPGMESWHPNPDFFYLPGAGPVLDIGPYYISNLVQLIGPVKEVVAMTSSARDSRVIGDGPREGEVIPVKTPTTIHAILRFHSGAQIGGDVKLTKERDEGGLPEWDHPFTIPNYGDDNDEANYRGAGLSDLSFAIQEDRPHRCSAEFAHHVVDVMTSILKAGDSGVVETISTTCDRPASMNCDEARSLMV